MEIRELRYFRAVVEAGSFMAASVTLHMSQPPLSLAIRKLEAELGVQLLVRSAKGVEPTSAGMYLLEAGSRVIGEVDEIVEHLKRHGAGTAGVVTAAAVPALMWARIPALLRQHAAANPDVEVRLVDPAPWTAIDMLLDRKVDVAFMLVSDAKAFADRHADRLDTLHWEDVPLVAAFPPGRSELPDPVPLAAFERETVVQPRRTLAVPSLPDAVGHAFTEHGVMPGRMRIAETIQTSIPLIQAGQAASILPDAMGSSVTALGLTVRSIREELPPLAAIAITPARDGRSPALSRLLESVVAQAEAVRPAP